jgi:glycosyltransferase involved in cell wall biosynthesis
MRKKNNPLISVLMTAYNAEKHIGLAIESILNQTYKNIEFIIVEDCSVDNTWDIIHTYEKKDQRIKAFRNTQNLKAGGSSNKGLKLCKGKYIVRMDADDWSYPYRIEVQLRFMENNPSIVTSGGALVVCDEKLKPLGIRHYKHNDKEIRAIALRLNPIPHPASIWRTETLKKTSLYPTNPPISEDYALTLEISQYGDLGNVDEALIKFRVHSKSISNSKMSLQQKATLQIAKKAEQEYGYRATMKDKIWRIIQRISMYTLPPKFKRYLLNLLVLDRDLTKI